jgi:hypothetical protein
MAESAAHVGVLPQCDAPDTKPAGKKAFSAEDGVISAWCLRRIVRVNVILRKFLMQNSREPTVPGMRLA